MPLCPRCHDEFQASVTSCPDCEVPLVDELPGETEDADLTPVLVVVEDPELRAEVGECLLGSRAPHRGIEDGFEVPLAVAQAVLQGLNTLFSVRRTEDERIFVVTGRQVFEPGPDPSILERPIEALANDLEGAVTALRALLRDGTTEQMRRATLRLGQLHARRAVDLTRCLVEALQEADRREVFAFSDLLRQCEAQGVSSQVIEVLPGLEPDSLCLALHVLGQHPDPGVIPTALGLLEHESAEVRLEADDVLCFVSGKDMGFEAEASESERAQAVARWRAWAVQD